ncbi:MAG: DUF4350 domain-containing protein [Candidatus Sericytochromatia bacterium]
MHATKFLTGFLICALLLACEPVNQPEPTPEPGVTPTPTTSGSPLPVQTLQVQVVVQDSSNQTIPGATVTLISPSQEPTSLSSNSSGRVSLNGLRIDADYSLEVSAPGYVSASRSLNLGLLPIQGQREPLLAIVLERANATVSGRILDEQGNPVVGATLFDTQQSIISGADGRFTLAYQGATSLSLTVAKAGFQSVTRPISVGLNQQQNLGDIPLSRLSRPLRIGLDAGHQALGQNGTAALQNYQGLKQTIAQQGYQVEEIEGNLNERLDQIDALFIISPTRSLSADERAGLQAWVLAGHKLIVSGEWAGFAGFSAEVSNQILQPFNLQFSGDTLRDNNSGYLEIRSFQAHPITSGLSSLKVYQSGSVRLNQADGNGEILARTSSTSFQILSNTGAFGVLAATPYGGGKAIALGDSSLWSDQDSDGNQVSNINEANNRQLLTQIIAW